MVKKRGMYRGGLFRAIYEFINAREPGTAFNAYELLTDKVMMDVGKVFKRKSVLYILWELREAGFIAEVRRGLYTEYVIVSRLPTDFTSKELRAWWDEKMRIVRPLRYSVVGEKRIMVRGEIDGKKYLEYNS